MGSQQLMAHCKACKMMTMHVRPSTSHVLHLLMSVITSGIWVVVWILAALANDSQKQCTVCGRTKGVFG